MFKPVRWFLPIALCGVAVICASAQKDPIPAGKAEKVAAAAPAEPLAKPKKPRKLLVFSRTNGYYHRSIPTGQEAMRVLGEKTGAFEAVISNDLANFEPEKIKDFDAICFLNTTQDVFAPTKDRADKMSEEERREADDYALKLRASLMDFIRNGGGFIGIHAATDTLYNWPEYGEMIGGYFNGHPWRAGDEVSIQIEPGKEGHVLTAMFEGENLDFKEEIYQFKTPYDSSKLEMLLRLDTEKTNMEGKGNRADNDYGVSWVRTWGEGRVFYCSLGHNEHIYWNPKVLRHYLAGTQWAMGDLEADVTK